MASYAWRSSLSSRWSRLINCPAASRSCSIFLSSAAVAVSGAILTIAVVSAVAACSPPAPMKHFVNESSDMGFSLELPPMGGVPIMSSSDQEYGASSDLQQLYLFRMKFRFVEVGPEFRIPIAEPSGASASNQHMRLPLSGPPCRP